MTAAGILATPARFPRLLLPAIPAKNPLDLDAAVTRGAFVRLRAAVEQLGADGVIDALAESGMRGRGGRGFPVGEKWRACAQTAAGRRYVVVNAYQADPAVLTDRVLLESNPYAVIEGAAIAAFAIGADEVIIAVRAERRRQSGHRGGNRSSRGRRLHRRKRPGQRDGHLLLGEAPAGLVHAR